MTEDLFLTILAFGGWLTLLCIAGIFAEYLLAPAIRILLLIRRRMRRFSRLIRAGW